ncbi:unnamed protein product [Mytilus coruscus]|uniref:Uncharacterized protein n=1 Tax=Mytilus coruscus TaxID=42192 RepID=A0A6J8DJY8_MYTCO|nr:unnamed protein product [Mytilus coruscus]
MINSTWRRSLLDVKVKRGADVGSEHQLITAFIQLKLRATGKKVSSRKRFDIDKLEDIKVKRDFVIRLQNRYQVLENSVRDENETLDEKWNEISDIYTKCSEECIGYKQKKKKKDWITPETWNQIYIRRQAKKKVNDTKSPRLKDKYQQDYSDIHRNVKTLVRADKRRFMDNLADQAEEAANKREQGNLKKLLKSSVEKASHLSGQYPPTNFP